MGQANNTGLNDGQSNRLVTPAHHVGDGAALVSPDDGFDQLLPVTPPGDQEHETSRPNQVTEQEHPRPDGQVVAAERVVAVNQLGGVEPEVVTEPTHQVGAGFVELSNVARPDGEVLPMPVEGEPAHGVQSPEDSQIEGVPSRDIAGTATAWAVAGEGITKVLLVRHQFGAASIQSTLDKDQGGGVQAQGDGMVNQEVTRADREEEIGTTVDGTHPAVHVGSVCIGSNTTGVGEQNVHSVHGFTGGSLNELGEHWFNQDLLLGCTEGNNYVVVNVETKGVETEE